MEADLKALGEIDRERDTQEKISLKDCIMLAAQESGQHVFKMTFKMLKLYRKHKISAQEFLDYGLYRSELSKEDKARFIAGFKHADIATQCSDLSWLAVTEDKFLCQEFLKSSSIPTPKTLAVIDISERDYLDVPHITNVETLKQFCLEGDRLPFFAKENRAVGRVRAFVVESANEEELELKHHGSMTYEQFFDEMVFDRTYLVQPYLKNHAFFEPLTDHLATVRIYNFVSEDEIYQPFFVLKIPNSTNLSGNFWSEGNVGCQVDGASGKIIKSVLKTPESIMVCDESTELYQYLEGKVLPDWAQIVQLSQRVARVFQPVSFQSLEFAMTDQGPVLLEVNTGGSFDLPQAITQEGFLTDKVKAFFESHGVEVKYSMKLRKCP